MRTRPLPALFGLLLLASLLAACGESPPDDVGPAPRAVVIRPGDGALASSLRAVEDPGRLFLVDPRDAARALRALVPEVSARGEPIVTYDAKRILFSGRRGEEEPWRIWSCDVEGGDLRLEVDALDDLASPALLPDGQVAYAAITSRPGPLEGWDAAWALHVAAGGGGVGRRITFGAGLDLRPVVLKDGRLLYGSWQPGGRLSEEGIFLFTVHPDGTGARRMPGPDGTRWHVAWRQLADGRILVVAKGAAYVRGEGGGAWTHVEEAEAETYLAIASAPVPLVSRKAPQGHLSVVDEERHHGDLLCLDAHRGEGAGTRVRLRALVHPYLEGGSPRAESLGTVDLHADGSFFVRVPADTPLLLDLLDEASQVLVEGETPFWVRPNETRACIGCHEDPRTAPPNRRPDAVRYEPVRLLGEEAGR